MIEVKRLTDDGLVIIIDGKDSLEIFKKLVQRATNLYPDATPEVKDFADQITNFELIPAGKTGIQDYRSQDTSKPIKRSL